MVVNGPRVVESPQQPPERTFLGGVTNKTAKLSFVDEEMLRKVGWSLCTNILIPEATNNKYALQRILYNNMLLSYNNRPWIVFGVTLIQLIFAWRASKKGASWVYKM